MAGFKRRGRPTQGGPRKILGRIRKLAASLEASELAHLDSVLALLAGLRRKGDLDEVKRRLDRSIVEELMDLLEKLRNRSPGAPPDPGFQWAVILELIALLLKLIGKLFALQEMLPPRLPPRLPRPNPTA